MQSTIDKKSETEIGLNVAATAKGLEPIVKDVYKQLRAEVKAAGFRPGKAPDHIVDRELGSQAVQEQVLKTAASRFYEQALGKHKLRPLGAPHVEVKKFVPFASLELYFTFEITPDIKLPEYKKIKKSLPKIEVTKSEIDGVIEGLRQRAAKRTEVKRPAKAGDEAVIDMKGSRDGRPVGGTTASNYSVLIGANRFVPGFEDNLIGLKGGESKEFEVTFPKDYHEVALQGQKVKFAVTLTKVKQVEMPAVDDKFAISVSPFKNLTELKTDIKKQVLVDKNAQAERALTDELVSEIINKSKFPLPKRLIEHQFEHLWAEFERNLETRGQKPEDYFKQAGQDRAQIEENLRAEAERRVKTGLVLSEVAKQENIKAEPDEVEVRLQMLKGRYQDKQMQTELDAPKARREIADQILIEKTVAKLVAYATGTQSHA